MTETTDTSRSLPLLEDQSSDHGGCGCGGCGCSAADTDSDSSMSVTTEEEISTTTRIYAVSGMTCGHCTGAVTRELKAVDGVIDVQVDLVAEGTSAVTVASQAPLEDAQVAAALEEAGGYQLV
jgi:copper chaperone